MYCTCVFIVFTCICICVWCVGATDDTIFTPVAEDGSDDEETIDYEEVTALKV